jgi:hypothetical protein
MFLWSIQITVVSIILIFLVHYLINYFKSTLTVPKIKDLVNTSTQKYDDMYNIITQQKMDDDLGYTEIDLLPKPNVDSMKNELKSFLKQQLKSANNSTSISTLDNDKFNTYSEY